MSEYVLALDQGTTSSRAILFDHEGRIVGQEQRDLPQHFPRPGWVEHDPEEIWRSQLGVARQLLASRRIGPKELAAIGITNQRETVVLWEASTGRPVAPALVWQDRRTSADMDRLRDRGLEERIAERTGLVLDAYFSASKLKWLLDNVPGARERAGRGELRAGTIDSWLIYRLSGGEAHSTDPGNASRTMLFDLEKLDWDDWLLDLFDIPRSLLPLVAPSSHVHCRAVALPGAEGVPVAGVAGDQQAATFGQACFAPGTGKNTYGTGCFMVVNTGDQRVRSSHRLISSVAWQLDGSVDYMLEGSIFIAGALVQWLRDGLGIIDTSQDIEPLARSVTGSEGVTIVPAFSGLGAPHWDQYARGTIIGITRGTTKAHLARAALEAIALQVCDVADAMGRDRGEPLSELRVDGGASRNDLLMQIQADLLGVPVLRPIVTETTALGAAFLAGLATGFWRDQQEISGLWQVDRSFEPALSPDRAAELRERWTRAVKRSLDWARE